MTYRKEIELVFDASSFLPDRSDSTKKQPVNSRIDLWYIGAVRDHNQIPMTSEKDFFLQCIRDHIRGLSQAETSIKNLLHVVSTSWNKARTVVDDVRLLNVSYPTEVAKTSDHSILVRSTLLIAPLTTKVEISIQLTSHSRENGIEVQIEPCARVMYGERFNEPKMGEFLLNRCGDIVEQRDERAKESWSSAVVELGDKLLARGRK
jgi:kinetochore protein Spc7/SPC105